MTGLPDAGDISQASLGSRKRSRGAANGVSGIASGLAPDGGRAASRLVECSQQVWWRQSGCG